MSTTIGIVSDALEPKECEIEIYEGTAGICVFAYNITTQKGMKVWLNATGRRKLIELLETSLILYK